MTHTCYEHMLITVSRPPIPRRVCCRATVYGFRPLGPGGCHSELVTIGVDELEAVRLADVEGLYQEAAAERMGVSRPTYARILLRARRAVAECLLERKRLVVAPSPHVQEADDAPHCPVHGGRRRAGRVCRCPARHEGRCGKRCGCVRHVPAASGAARPTDPTE